MGEHKFPDTGINKYVFEYIRDLPDLSGKTVLDIPCGDGRASHEFNKKGADVSALDLYPEFMKAEGIKALFADLADKLPVEDNSMDYIICQEGIEHVPDQVRVLREFNRVLRKNGLLILTTPSMSHLRARLSYFLLESDYWRRMAPSEIDSIWFSEKHSNRIYFGHLFLTGVHHLQSIATFTGFKVKRRIRTDISNSSALLSFILYPFVLVSTLCAWMLYRRKNSHIKLTARKKLLWDRLKLNLSLKTLLCKHMFWVMVKEQALDERINALKSMTIPLHGHDLHDKSPK